MKRHGSILIFVIWILLLLTVLAASVALRSRLEIKLTSFYGERLQDDYMMLSAVHAAMYLINQDDDASVDSDRDSWYGDPSGFGDFSLSKEIVLTIEDEESKLNLNKVNDTILGNFFKILKENGIRFETEPNDMIVSIMAWQGKPLRTVKGKTSMGFEHKKAPFETVEELKLIQYITPKDYEAIKPFFTTYGKTADFWPRVNVNTAHDWILKAIIQSLPGGEQEKKQLFDNLQFFRKGDPQNPEKSPGMVFTPADLRGKVLLQKLGLPETPSMIGLINMLQQYYLTADSQFFFVHVETQKGGLEAVKVVEAVLGTRQGVLQKSSVSGSYQNLPVTGNVLQGYPYDILYWNERVLR